MKLSTMEIVGALAVGAAALWFLKRKKATVSPVTSSPFTLGGGSLDPAIVALRPGDLLANEPAASLRMPGATTLNALDPLTASQWIVG